MLDIKMATLKKGVSMLKKRKKKVYGQPFWERKKRNKNITNFLPSFSIKTTKYFLLETKCTTLQQEGPFWDAWVGSLFTQQRQQLFLQPVERGE